MTEKTTPFILLVDDDETFAADLLAVWAPPYPVRHVASADAARRVLACESPQLVVLDLCLPDGNAEISPDVGLQLLTDIRATVAIPVVVLSRDAPWEALRNLLAAGPGALVEKPADICELDNAVQRLLPSGRRASQVDRSLASNSVTPKCHP